MYVCIYACSNESFLKPTFRRRPILNFLINIEKKNNLQTPKNSSFGFKSENSEFWNKIVAYFGANPVCSA